MKLIKRVSIISFVITTAVFANNSIDKSVIEFEKSRFSKNERVEIKNISINMKKELPQKGWYGYIVDLDIKFAGKDVKAKDVIFSDGNVISPELFDVKSGDSLKELIRPNLSSKYYDSGKLIAGSSSAKNKLVVFSDPLCPFCMDYVPDIAKYANEHKDSIALYYYHFPLLRIHPASNALTKLMVIGKKKGIKDIELKVYKADWDIYFEPKETNQKKILDAFNKVFETKITLEELDSKEISAEVAQDISMGEEALVQGTPTIFVNGEYDKSKLKYQELGM
ncbi:DsbA family protein [Halarcobacter ebronensis]|uniref:Disulfide bond formation protein DsbA n=1 Tax=Halarcobacter ebronensis TaxID=1462615 RepID=A0A4Q1APK1_9BACT|nr:thioredoxin domain-containing protein [Halarcobacter ebronensis]QKF83083.1 protein disulfide isomerase [Halarcobacter ebronensis]RXK02402.1 disulfide bond formation protein DsbA [Halarcobacter ebronensis]